MKDLLAPAADDPTVSPPRPHTAADFRAFVEPHWPTMARFARHLVGPDVWEDLVQDALSTAWRKRRQFDPAKGSAGSWLLAIVADKARKSRRRSTPRDVPLRELGHHPDPTSRLDLRAAIARLPARQQQVITLRFYLNFSTDETAHVMSCSEGTVKSTLSDAKRRLKHLLGEDYFDA